MTSYYDTEFKVVLLCSPLNQDLNTKSIWLLNDQLTLIETNKEDFLNHLTTYELSETKLDLKLDKVKKLTDRAEIRKLITPAYQIHKILS